MSRLAETLRTIPPATLGIVGLCSLLYLVQVIANVPALHSVAFCPRLVVYDGQVYRVVTSALYHGSLMHIAMNAMSTTAIGSMLERRLGTMRLFFTMLLSIWASSMLYIGAAIFLAFVFGRSGLMNQHSVGFSGVIFHLSVLECYLNAHESSRSVFGVLQVPTFTYPWVL
jgi:membrane associated rhomboid family serine protease